MSLYQDYKLILASSSAGRLSLLENAGLKPDLIIPADIDETVLKKEQARNLVARLSKEKALLVAKSNPKSFIIAADTVGVASRKILNKATTDAEVASSLKAISGKRHRIYTGVTILRVDENGEISASYKFVETILKFKKLSKEEVEYYINSGEGIGKAGGYAIQGKAAIFLEWIRGSFSNIVGLPLNETYQSLNGLGYKLK